MGSHSMLRQTRSQERPRRVAFKEVDSVCCSSYAKPQKLAFSEQ